jgi:hypothetical protein
LPSARRRGICGSNDVAVGSSNAKLVDVHGLPLSAELKGVEVHIGDDLLFDIVGICTHGGRLPNGAAEHRVNPHVHVLKTIGDARRTGADLRASGAKITRRIRRVVLIERNLNDEQVRRLIERHGHVRVRGDGASSQCREEGAGPRVTGPHRLRHHPILGVEVRRRRVAIQELEVLKGVLRPLPVSDDIADAIKEMNPAVQARLRGALAIAVQPAEHA